MSFKPLYRFVCLSCRLFFRLLYRHRVYVAQPLPKGSAILAANHASFFDPPLIAISTKEEVHFLARESLFRFFGFGWFIRQLNAHPIAHASQTHANLKVIAKILHNGEKVVIFPEGTRSKDGELQTIKHGVAMLSLQAQCPIVPIWIEGSYAVWGRHRRLPHPFGRTACVFGTPLDPLSIVKECPTSKERIEKLSQELECSLRELEQWYRNGAVGSPP